MARTIQHSVTHYDPSKAYNGYTLFAPLGEKNVWLIDMQGQIVHQWMMPRTPGCHGVLLPNGNLLYAARPPERPLPNIGGGGGNMVEVDWDGNLIWKQTSRLVGSEGKAAPQSQLATAKCPYRLLRFSGPTLR